jgi:hypothetical protein
MFNDVVTMLVENYCLVRGYKPYKVAYPYLTIYSDLQCKNQQSISVKSLVSCIALCVNCVNEITPLVLLFWVSADRHV